MTHRISFRILIRKNGKCLSQNISRRRQKVCFISICYAPLPALALCAAAHILQACRHGIPVRRWTWTDLPGRPPSAGRQDSRSTPPAVIVDVGIGRPVYTTVHCRRPSVSRRRGTNMEQFDRSKWPHQILCKPSKPNESLFFSWRRLHSF